MNDSARSTSSATSPHPRRLLAGVGSPSGPECAELLPGRLTVDDADGDASVPEVVQRAIEDDLGCLGRVRIVEAQVLVVHFVQSLLGTCLEDPKAQVNGESLAVDGFADDPLRVRVILVRPVDPDDGALFVQQLPANGDGGKGGKSAENPRVFPSRAGRTLHSPSWGASKRDAVSSSGGAGTAGAHHRFAMPIAIHPLFHGRSTHVGDPGLGDASPSGAGEARSAGVHPACISPCRAAFSYPTAGTVDSGSALCPPPHFGTPPRTPDTNRRKRWEEPHPSPRTSSRWSTPR